LFKGRKNVKYLEYRLLLDNMGLLEGIRLFFEEYFGLGKTSLKSLGDLLEGIA